MGSRLIAAEAVRRIRQAYSAAFMDKKTEGIILIKAVGIELLLLY